MGTVQRHLLTCECQEEELWVISMYSHALEMTDQKLFNNKNLGNEWLVSFSKRDQKSVKFVYCVLHSLEINVLFAGFELVFFCDVLCSVTIN